MQYIKQTCYSSEPSKSGIQNTAKATSDLVGNKLLIKLHVQNFKVIQGLFHKQKENQEKYQKKDNIPRKKRASY